MVQVLVQVEGLSRGYAYTPTPQNCAKHRVEAVQIQNYHEVKYNLFRAKPGPYGYATLKPRGKTETYESTGQERRSTNPESTDSTDVQSSNRSTAAR